MPKVDFSEAAAALRHARMQLGWSQEMFAEKAILSDRTILEAEAGKRILPRTFRVMVEAINKARAAARPPIDPLILEYPVSSPTAGPEPTAQDSEAADPATPPAAQEPDDYPETVAEPLAVEEPPAFMDPAAPFSPIKGVGAPPRIIWPEDDPLLSFGSNGWRVRDACQGTVIFGATGSGKTSGSGQCLAKAYLRAGFGGLVLCAKPDEATLWTGYAASCGREADLVLFGRDPRWSFNFLEHESRRQGSGANLTENLVNLFTEIASIGAGPASSAAGDPFWERAMKSLVRNCVDLLAAAGAPITLHNMFEVVRSSPANLEMIQSEAWKSGSACWRHLESARKRVAGGGARIDFHEVASYWLEHFPTLGERTRGSIVAIFLTLSEPLMRSKMRQLFCAGTTLAPEDILSGRIVVIDLPVKEWGEVGRIAAVLWKYCFQKTVERRQDNATGQGRPVFLWADECQYFFSRHDSLFQATARSSRAATVYLTQSIPTLVAALGSEAEGRSLVDSVLNNLVTKIFHANSDPTTNDYASNLIGKEVARLRNAGTSIGNAGISSSFGFSEQINPIIQPHEFSRLKRGSAESQFQVEGIVLQMQRMFESRGQIWQKVAFDQRPKSQAATITLVHGRSRPSGKASPIFRTISEPLLPWKRAEGSSAPCRIVSASLWFLILMFAGIAVLGAYLSNR